MNAAPLIDIQDIYTEHQRGAIIAQYGKAITALSEVGRILSETSKQLNDVSFEDFLKTLPFSRRSAYNYMRLFEHVQSVQAVAQANVQISAWYHVPSDNTELIQAIIAKAETGRVTSQDVKALLNTVSFETERQQSAWQNAAATNPKFVVESIARGVVTGLDGEDMPIEQADATLIHVNSVQDTYESIKRQQIYVTEKGKPKQRWQGTFGELLKMAQNGQFEALPDYSVEVIVLWKEGE